MSVSTMKAPHELIGKSVAEAARYLQPESLIAVIDETGEITMAVDILLNPTHHRTISEHDKLDVYKRQVF